MLHIKSRFLVICFLLIACPVFADTTISDLVAATTLNDADVLVCDQGGVTKKISWLNLYTALGLGTPSTHDHSGGDGGQIDHGGLAGLGDDDHSGYPWLVGRNGGQTLYGDTAASGALTLGSTYHATKGKIFFGTSAYDEATNRFGLGTATPAFQYEQVSSATTYAVYQQSTDDSTTISFIARKSRGTVGTPTQTKSGDALFSFGGAGYRTDVDGTSNGAWAAASGLIQIKADEDLTNGTPNKLGGHIEFHTTTLATSTRAERLRVTNAGYLAVGNSTYNSAVTTGPLMIGPPDSETIAAAATITANACGTIKQITASGAVTTNTTDTFTAPAAGNKGCCMDVVNVGTTNNITLDNNAHFFSAGAADVVMTPYDSVRVCSNGTAWYMIGGLGAN